MFCPECKAEYRQGFTRCNDCDVALVDHLPDISGAPVPSDDAKPVVVFATSNVYEAELIKSLLEASGIDVYPFNENSTVPVGSIELVVTSSQENLARDVLEEYRGKAGQSPTDGQATPVSSSDEMEEEPGHGE